MHSVLNTFFQTPVSGEEKGDAYRSAFLVRIYLPYSSQSFDYTAAERTQYKSLVQYLLSVEQMVEKDYPVPAYHADVFQKSEG